MIRQLFEFKGRLSRVSYATNMAVYVAVLFVFLFTESQVRALGDMSAIITIALVGVMLWILISSMARRFHDIGKSAYAVLLILIPIVGQITPFALLVYPGDENENEFGPPST